MKALIIIATLLFVTGCAKEPLSSSRTNNSEITVDFLFEKDGIKVYRFMDGGHYIYFTNQGRVMWEQKEGKTSRPMSVE